MFCRTSTIFSGNRAALDSMARKIADRSQISWNLPRTSRASSLRRRQCSLNFRKCYRKVMLLRHGLFPAMSRRKPATWPARVRADGSSRFFPSPDVGRGRAARVGERLPRPGAAPRRPRAGAPAGRRLAGWAPGPAARLSRAGACTASEVCKAGRCENAFFFVAKMRPPGGAQRAAPPAGGGRRRRFRRRGRRRGPRRGRRRPRAVRAVGSGPAGRAPRPRARGPKLREERISSIR